MAKNFVLRAAAFGPALASAGLRAAEGRALDPTAFARGQRSRNNNPVLADPATGLAGTATQTTTDAFSAGQFSHRPGLHRFRGHQRPEPPG